MFKNLTKYSRQIVIGIIIVMGVLVGGKSHWVQASSRNQLVISSQYIKALKTYHLKPTKQNNDKLKKNAYIILGKLTNKKLQQT